MSFITNIKKNPVFGFENRFRLEFKATLPEYTMRNVCKIVGYIPILGIAGGAVHLYEAITNTQQPTWQRVARGGRGICEICCVGVIFLPVDIVKSLVDLAIVGCGKKEYRPTKVVHD